MFNSYLDRDEFLVNMAQNKKVLHLGCVGSTFGSLSARVDFSLKSLHGKLTKVSDVTGVDYSQDVIMQYRKLGIFDNILVGNVEQLDELKITDKFDLVIAGDIIEHLSNPGFMLEGIKRFCHNNTVIIITTPHAFGFTNFTKFLLGKYKDGPGHVMTFNVDNIKNFLNRHGYRVEEVSTCFQSLSVAQYPGWLFGVGKNIFTMFPKLGGTLLISAKLI